MGTSDQPHTPAALPLEKELPAPTGQESRQAAELVWTWWWKVPYPCQESNTSNPAHSL